MSDIETLQANIRSHRLDPSGEKVGRYVDHFTACAARQTVTGRPEDMRNRRRRAAPGRRQELDAGARAARRHTPQAAYALRRITLSPQRRGTVLG